ncbi:MAG: methyltransferase [Polyangiaceae bacterium]
MSAKTAAFSDFVFHQPARGTGYRANVDALHLAAFAMAGRRAKVAFDLGAGAGAVGLTLIKNEAAGRVVLVEIDPEAAALAARNLSESGWDDRGEVLEGDVTKLSFAHAGEADLVTCNPPYTEPSRGRVPPEPRRARARSGSLAVFVEAARRFAGRRARVCFVYPAPDLATLIATFRGAGIEPKRLRAVHARATSPARIVLVEGQAAKPGGLVVEPPLIET